MNEDFQNIRFEMSESVATLTLNRPGRLNSFADAMHAEVRVALGRIRADQSVRALVTKRAPHFTGE